MKNAFIILEIAICVYSASALPVQARKGVEPAWKAEPHDRGTVGLLLPCIITLTLRVWTAIHLNINSKPTKRRLLVFKFVWVFMGIFTPELILWCSSSQYFEASKVRELILEIRFERHDLPLPLTMWQKGIPGSCHTLIRVNTV